MVSTFSHRACSLLEGLPGQLVCKRRTVMCSLSEVQERERQNPVCVRARAHTHTEDRALIRAVCSADVAHWADSKAERVIIRGIHV